MTAATLRNYTAKNLAQMAKDQGVSGWHAMRKEQLVRALTQRPSSKRARSVRGKSHTIAGLLAPKPIAAKKKPNVRVQKQVSQLRAQMEEAKDLARKFGKNNGAKEIHDRLVVMVRDPYWLQAYWELNPNTIARMRAALGQHWYLAKPVLRLFEVVNTGTATPSDTSLRTIEIHGGVNNWYIDVQKPESTYRVEIGYLASDEKFYPIARSNSVTTPSAAVRSEIDFNWADLADNFDKIYAMSGGYSPEGTSQELREVLEERLRRPMGTPVSTGFGAGACNVLNEKRNFHFEADAEMVVFGSTHPSAHVTLMGEPVQLRDDGSFTVRIDMPNRRQVIPVVASSSDGIEQHTIVVAIERNTKRMEAVFKDSTG